MGSSSLTRLRVRNPRLYAAFRSFGYALLGFYGATVARAYGAMMWPVYRRTYRIRRLHLGCSELLRPHWFNTDKYPRRIGVAYCDATVRYPFEDSVFDYIFTEHMIEHVPYSGARSLVRECFRVLKPGGKIRISTPDLDRILALRHPTTELEKEYVKFALGEIPETVDGQTSFLINRFMRAWGHTFIYDRETLSGLMHSAGFADITERRPGESDDPEFAGLERHGETFPNPEFNLIESMVLEGTKPTAVPTCPDVQPAAGRRSGHVHSL
jgi:predicted SAM-dependent methyltransferase